MMMSPEIEGQGFTESNERSFHLTAGIPETLNPRPLAYIESNWFRNAQLRTQIDMTISSLFNFISTLSETTGLSVTAMMFICVVWVLILTSGFAILLQLRSTGNVLLDADRDLEELAQTFGQASTKEYLPEKFRSIPKSDPEENGFIDTYIQDNDTRKPGMESQVTEGLKGNVLTKLKDYLKGEKAQPPAEIRNEAYALSLISNSDLKQRILDLINKTDKSISLQYLAKNLSKQYFDGNYHPVLNELDRLEKDGEIEGRVINGKVFYKKKIKETRKYVIRKGKNFRKFMG